MKKIFKQIIKPNSIEDKCFPIEFRAPQGARPISVHMQDNLVCMWYECDPEAPPTDQFVYSVGTGFGAVPEGGRFVGTVTDGPYVWHIYSMVQ